MAVLITNFSYLIGTTSTICRKLKFQPEVAQSFPFSWNNLF